MTNFLPSGRCDDIIVSYSDVEISNEGWFEVPFFLANHLNNNTIYIAVDQMCLNINTDGFSGTERIGLICKQVYPSNDFGRNIIWSSNASGGQKIFGIPHNPNEIAFYKTNFENRFAPINKLDFAFGRSGTGSNASIVTKASLNSFVFRVMLSLESNKESKTPAASTFAKHFQDDKIRIKL